MSNIAEKGTSFINVINLISPLGEVKTFFNLKDSSYLYLLPSLLVNFLANYLELIMLFLQLVSLLIITCDVPVFYVKYCRKRENI
jgi:hypothetical protein